MESTTSHQTHIPLPSSSGGKQPDHDAQLSLVPIHIVTDPSQLPTEFLQPSSEKQLIIGFDCEGVDLCRYGTLCIMQLAFPDAVYLVDAIQGGNTLIQACKPALESTYITKVIHDCKRDSEALYFQFGIKLNNVVDTQYDSGGPKIDRHLDLNIPNSFITSDVSNGGLHLFTWAIRHLHTTLQKNVLLEDPHLEDGERHVSSKLELRNFKNYNHGFKESEISTPLQIAYSLIEEQEGRKRSPDDYISFVGLLADPRYCGISYLEKEEVRILLRQDPGFWTYRPLSELMIRAAADDVRFLLYIYHKMMEKLNQRSLWYLAIRGALYCRCFCISDNDYANWPPLPQIPDSLIAEGNVPEDEILSVLDVPSGKMGRVIGRRGASIMSVKESCNAEILIGGAKGPPDKVFIIGPVKQVRKAEAILRGSMLEIY